MLSIRIAGGWLYAMRRVLATICIAVLAMLIGYKAIFGANGMKVWQSKRAEATKLQQQIAEQQIEHQRLEHEVELLQKADPDTIEREAREQLGYVKPGEHVLYEPRPKPEVTSPATAEEHANRAP